MFVKPIDDSKFLKIKEKLFQMLDTLVEEIGEQKMLLKLSQIMEAIMYGLGIY